MDAASIRVRYDALIATEHDDPSCECEHCQRDRGREEARIRAGEARVRGGLAFPLAVELFGSRWLSDLSRDADANATRNGGNMAADDVAQIAQIGLASIFETMGRVAEAARERCHPRYSHEPPAPAHAAELLALIDYGEELINVARSHMHFMPTSAFQLSEAVAFARADGTTAIGLFSGATRDGRASVRLPDPAGDRWVAVPYRELRKSEAPPSGGTTLEVVE